jgi:WD40 repeat protein
MANIALDLRFNRLLRWFGVVLALAVAAGQPRLLAQQHLVLNGHTATVRWVAFATDGKELASAGDDGTVRIWDVSAAKQVKSLKHDVKVRCAALSPDSKTLALVRDEPGANVLLWNKTTNDQQLLRGTGAIVLALAFSPDGKTLASGGIALDMSEEIVFWDVATGRERAALRGRMRQRHVPGEPRHDSGTNEGCVFSLAYSSDGRFLAAGTGDTTRLWHIPTLTLRANFPQGYIVDGVAISRDAKTLYALTSLVKILAWDMGNFMQLARADAGDFAALAPDARTIATGSRNFRLLEGRTLKVGFDVPTWAAHERFCCAAYSPDGKILATGDYRGALRLWTSANLSNQMPIK